jgi:hypothetical protein
LSQVEALKALEVLACLSQPLAEKCVGLNTCLLQPKPEYTRSSRNVTVQAIKFLKAIIQAFPTAYGSLMPSFAPLLALGGTPPARALGPTLTSSSAARISNKEIISIAAAGSFTELLLSNKIKVHEWMGILGSGLSSTVPAVTSTCSLALRQLLTTSRTSGDRASFVLDIAQQTPITHRLAATKVAFQLLPAVDLSSDALVGPCITAALNACQPATALGAARDVGLQVALEMLCVLSPSVKMLKMLQKGLQQGTNGAGGGIGMRELRREFEKFIKRATATNDEADFFINSENNASNKNVAGNGKKRGRAVATTVAAKATAVKNLQQDILSLLVAKKIDQKRRSSRK